MKIEDRDVEEAVIAAIAHACRVEPAAVSRATRLLDLDMDSLTLAYVLSTVQADRETELDATGLAEALSARDVAELAAAVANGIRRHRK
jgi:hypothetical protein